MSKTKKTIFGIVMAAAMVGIIVAARNKLSYAELLGMINDARIDLQSQSSLINNMQDNMELSLESCIATLNEGIANYQETKEKSKGERGLFEHRIAGKSMVVDDIYDNFWDELSELELTTLPVKFDPMDYAHVIAEAKALKLERPADAVTQDFAKTMMPQKRNPEAPEDVYAPCNADCDCKEFHNRSTGLDEAEYFLKEMEFMIKRLPVAFWTTDGGVRDIPS